MLTNKTDVKKIIRPEDFIARLAALPAGDPARGHHAGARHCLPRDYRPPALPGRPDPRERGPASASNRQRSLTWAQRLKRDWIPPRPKKPDFIYSIVGRQAKYYGAHWCPYCKKQNALFGEDVRYLPYVECSPPGSRATLSRCKHIEAYPTWTFPQAGKRGGVQSFSALEKLTGCTLQPRDYFVD